MSRDPVDRARLDQVRPRVSRRRWLAILALLGLGGGATVYTRPWQRLTEPDRTDTRPVDPGTRPPYQRPDDPTRPPPVDPPPSVDYPTTTVTKNSTWGTYDLAPEQTGVAFLASGPPDGQMGAMIGLASYGKLHEGYAITDCLFATTSPHNMQWGVRAYDVIDWTIRRSEFRGPGQEHGAYLNAPGAFLIEDCLFSGWGGAGIQVTYRKADGKYAAESVDPKLAEHGGTHTYRRVTIRDCGDPASDRFGAYLLSEHAPEVNWTYPDGSTYQTYRLANPVAVDECVIRGGNLDMDYKGQNIRSTRGLLVQQRPSLIVTGSVVDVPQPMDGWNSQIWAVDEVVLRDSEFNGGTIEIRWAKSVRIENCRGDARVIVGGGEWNKWPMADKIYDAPISADWSWSE